MSCPQAVFSDSSLYADNICIVFQQKIATEIEKKPLKDFSSFFRWFVDNKLSINFSQNKRKSVLFGTKHKLPNVRTLKIVHNDTEIKQYAKIKRLGCILHQIFPGEPMALNVIDKVNLRLEFLHRENRFLIPLLRKLCNALIQRLFDYTLTA